VQPRLSQDAVTCGPGSPVVRHSPLLVYCLCIIEYPQALGPTSTVVQIASVRWQIGPAPPVLSRASSRPSTYPVYHTRTLNFLPMPQYLAQYLRPLSVPSRHTSTCDESPCSSSHSSTSAASPTPLTPQSGRHFLNIPGLQTQQSIKDADDVDKLANAAVSPGTSRRRTATRLVTYLPTIGATL
jgi:hypothetical protein